MDRQEVARALEEIASLLELEGENAFKVRAFRNAARTVETWSGDLFASLASGELAARKGIGPATLDVVRECVTEGKSRMLEELRAAVPPGLTAMLRIGGMGVAKVRAVREQLGITDLARLEAAARDGRLAALPRFGEKTAAKILKGIEFLVRTGAYRLYHHAARQAAQLRAALAALPGVAAVEVAGSVRRRMEVVRDLDLVVAATVTPVAIRSAVVERGIARDVSEGPGGVLSIRLDADTKADILVAAPDLFGHRLALATGSAGHADLLRERASAVGLRLDAEGLFREGVAVPCPDEAAFFAALGLVPIPPEIREGTDEVARAASGSLPRLVERGDLLGFLHFHTTYSDGSAGLAEMAEACAAEGYRYAGVTDHSVAAAYAGGLSESDVARQHAEVDALNRAGGPLRLLKGVEADILPDGRLDYAPEVLDRFDFVIGSVHSRFEMDEGAMTERVLRAMEDPRLGILGHPTGRLLLSRDAYPLDVRRVIARAAELGVAIEINGDPQRLDLDWRLCREARDAGVLIAIGSDAHSTAGVGNIELGVGIARKGWLGPRDILNSLDAEGFLDRARSRR